MQPSADAAVLEIVAETHGRLELPELVEAMLEVLPRVIPSQYVSLNEMGAPNVEPIVVTRPELAARWYGLFARHGHENPLFRRWLETRDGRAYRFSDVMPESERSKLTLFREVYEPLGVRHQLACTLPSPADRVLAIALSRDSRDYSDHERSVLDRARPFLIQAYRNAIAYTAAMQARPEPETIERLLRARGLTRRQAQILQRVAHGRSNETIGDELGVAASTVKKHLEMAYRRLKIGSRDQAAAFVWTQASAGEGPAQVATVSAPSSREIATSTE